MPKVRVNETTATTSEPMHMHSTKYHKKSIKIPGRFGEHHGYIKSHG